MRSQKSIIRAELKSICRYRSLSLSRMVLLLLLILICYPFFPTAVYLLTAVLAFPVILNYGIQAAHPDRNQQIRSDAVLSETMKKYHFIYTKYRSEVISFYLFCLLLLVWQIAQPKQDWHGIPIWVIPGILLAIYLLTERIIYFCLHWKLHYDFTHIKIED